MTPEEMNTLYSEVNALQAAGSMGEAKALLMKNLSRLPEDIRANIMLEMFTSSLEEEAAGLAFTREIQEEGLRAAEELEKRAEKDA